MFKSPRDIDFDNAVEGYEDFTISDLQLLPRSKKESIAMNCEIYFTGFCNRGHLAIRNVNQGRCIKCIAKDNRTFYDANKEDIIKKTVEYLNNRYKNDHNFKAQRILRLQVTRLIKTARLEKTTSTETIVGYSSEQFKNNIESKFEAGMNWDNYGNVWQIDHVKPVALFDMTNLDCLKRVNSLDNLVPMFIDKHRSKTVVDMINIMDYKRRKEIEA